MIGANKTEKFYTCPQCGVTFSSLDVDRFCSNCFACTGCEVFLCPSCGEEVVIKPIKQMKRTNSQ